MRFTGRKGKYKPTSKHKPSVRFRQINYKDKIESNKITKQKRKAAARPLLGPFTLVGLSIFAGLIALIGFLAWFFIFSTNFLVSSVTITSPTSLSKEQINSAFYDLQDQRVLFFIPGNHIVFLNETRVNKVFTRKYPHVKSLIDFDRDWPDKVSFALEDKTPVFFYLTSDGKGFSLDAEGKAIKATQDTNGLVVIESNTTQEVLLGENVLGSNILDFAKKMEKQWPKYWDFRPVRYKVGLDLVAKEVEIHTSENWYVRADSSHNPETVFNHLKLLLDEEIQTPDKRKDLVYIDLRLNDRAFYCLKGNPCAR